MAPTQQYYGLISMADSRHASPYRRRQVEAILASHPELKAKKDAKNILATREQVAATDNMERGHSDGFHLAQAQTEAIQQEVAQHTRDVERTVSSVHTTTRQILNLIRDAIQKERPGAAAASLQVVDNLWEELEELFEVARKAKEAVPYFMEKQKENTSLIAGTMVQDAYDDIQHEMDQKDQKLRNAQDINFGQQQAKKDIKTNFNCKNTEFQERITRVQLEQGSLKTELDQAKGQFATTKAAQQNIAKATDELQKQMDALNELKTSTSADNDNLRGSIKDLGTKLKAAEEKATEHYKKEMRSVTDKLLKEQQKATALDVHLKALRQIEEATRKEMEKVKCEHKLLSEKYKNQSGMFVKVSEDLKEQTKRANALQSELDKLQQQKTEVKQERATFPKDSLQNQHDALKSQLDELRKQLALVDDEVVQLSEKLKRTETENNDLRVKQLQHNNVIAAFKKAEGEIAALRATMQNMKTASPTTSNSAELVTLKEQLQEVNEKLTKSEVNRSEWEELGRKAMLQFREAQKKNNQVDDIRKQLARAQTKNEQLQAKVTELQSVASPHEDAKYWRDRYNELLEEMEG